METIEQRALKLRKELGLSQIEFSKVLSLSHGSISRWETGRDPISEQNIRMIILSFNVRERWLRFGEGDMFDLADNDPLINEVIELMKKMPAEDRQVALNYVRWYASQQQTLAGKESPSEKGEESAEPPNQRAAG